MKPRKGHFFGIELNDGRYVFGRVLKNPLCAFYASVSDHVLDVDEITGSKVAFKVWVMDNAFERPNWRIIGFRSLEAQLEKRVWFFKQDPISKTVSLYSEGEERPVSKEECRNVERAAVWSAQHRR